MPDEPVDLVDEEHVALLEIGEQRREVARLGDDRAGGGAEIDAEFARDDLRQRGLAETRRADEQHMVERFGRALAASMKTFRFARACRWPMNSASGCGRSEVSACVPRAARGTSGGGASMSRDSSL